jgi:hypothetical protein
MRTVKYLSYMELPEEVRVDVGCYFYENGIIFWTLGEEKYGPLSQVWKTVDSWLFEQGVQYGEEVLIG